jgi:hypothetical protein
MNLKKKKDYKSFQINVREKTEGVIKNGQSRETGNTGNTRHKTKTKQNTTQYALDTNICI